MPDQDLGLLPDTGRRAGTAVDGFGWGSGFGSAATDRYMVWRNCPSRHHSGWIYGGIGSNSNAK